MKPGDIIQTKKGPALFLGGDTKDEKNYKFPVVSGLGAAAGQGLTFRFLDEIVGTARGILPGGITPQQGRELERAAFERVQKEQPVAALAAEIGGAAVPALLSFGATAPVSATGIGTAAARAGLAWKTTCLLRAAECILACVCVCVCVLVPCSSQWSAGVVLGEAGWGR